MTSTTNTRSVRRGVLAASEPVAYRLVHIFFIPVATRKITKLGPVLAKYSRALIVFIHRNKVEQFKIKLIISHA